MIILLAYDLNLTIISFSYFFYQRVLICFLQNNYKKYLKIGFKMKQIELSLTESKNLIKYSELKAELFFKPI